ncbi:MAG: MauE/DoxX family redox-associated membrane protein [Acidobacteriota bacterium]
MSLWRRLPAYLATAAVGGMLLAAGLLKGLDPAGFATQMRTDVPLLSGLAPLLALGGIAGEILLGTAYLLGFRHRLLLGVGGVLILVFLGVTVPKLGTDDAASCGCFGNFVVRTPVQAIREDALMLGALILGLAGGRGSRLTRWRGTLLALAAAVGIGLPLAAPSLPLDNFATRLKPGASLADLQLLEALPDLASGRHVVVLTEMNLESCDDVPESFYAFADAHPEAQYWMLTPSDVLSRDGATWICHFGTEVVEIPRVLLDPLYRTLPRSFLAEDGVVTETIEGLPASPVPKDQGD